MSLLLSNDFLLENKILYNFRHTQLSNEAVKIAHYCYIIFKIHLTNPRVFTITRGTPCQQNNDGVVVVVVVGVEEVSVEYEQFFSDKNN